MIDFIFWFRVILVYFGQVVAFHHDPVLDDLNLPSFQSMNQFHQELFVAKDVLFTLIAFSIFSILKSL